jgi:uncharacterized alpha-E superfamily protein
MILLSSAAQNIFWLGRYLSRIQQICSLLPVKDDEYAIKYSHLFCLPAWNSSSLNGLFLDPEQPFSISAQFACVRDNIQQLRAVLSGYAYAELNKLTKIADEKTLTVCQVVSDCSEVLEGEVEQVFLFYALGRAVELLDNQCRLEVSADEQIHEIAKILKLLKSYGWDTSETSWDKLVEDANMSTLYQFCNEVSLMFEEV